MHDHIQQYLLYLEVEEEASDNTIAAYRNDLSQLYLFLSRHKTPLGEKITTWREVDEVAVQNYLLDLKKRDYASSTVARKVAAIKSFFDYMVSHGHIDVDPAAAMESPKVKKHLPHAISHEDVERLLAAPARAKTPQALRDVALLETLYATGVRVTELVNLNVYDADLPHKRLICAGSRRSRVAPLDARALAALTRYLEEGRHRLVVDPNEDALFLNHRGQRLTRQGLWLIIKRYVKEVGIKEQVTPHTLRHSFATHMLNRGAGLREVQERLGHASLSTTQVYKQVTNETPSELIIDDKPVDKDE